MNKYFNQTTMRRSVITIFTLFFLTAGIRCAYSQNFTATILAMKDSIAKAEKIHITMNVVVFENSPTGTPVYHDRVDICRQNDNYRYRYGSNDLLMNNHMILMVDKKEKEIACKPRDKKGEKEAAKQLSFNIDSVFSLFNKPDYIGREGMVDHFRIVPKTGPVREVNWYVSTQSSLPARLEYRYSNGLLVSVVFEAFDIHADFKEDTFDEKQYIARDKKKIVGIGNFKQYEVLSDQKIN